MEGTGDLHCEYLGHVEHTDLVCPSFFNEGCTENDQVNIQSLLSRITVVLRRCLVELDSICGMSLYGVDAVKCVVRYILELFPMHILKAKLLYVSVQKEILYKWFYSVFCAKMER